MSIRVMSEFFGLQLGSANRKMVALRLADFADDAGRGIWPTVERVAAECEISVSTVQRVLKDFVAEGILVVVKAGGGGRGSSTRYDFDLDRVRVRAAEIAAGQLASAPDLGCQDDTLSEEPGKGVTDAAKGVNDEALGCHGDTRTVIEPSENPSSERERASEREDDTSEPRAPGERAFRRAFAAWPTYLADSEPAARKAWEALSADERNAAIERLADYVASVKATGRSKYCSFGVYLAEHRWTKLPAKAPAPVSDYAPPYGPVWSAWRMAHLLTTPAVHGASADARWPLVGALHAKARLRKGHRFGERWRAADISALMVPVPVGTGAWEAWETLHAERGWPWLPDPGDMPVVYFPAGGPAGLAEFERAVRGNEHDGRSQAAE